jgi:hypothetical protein
MKKLSVLTITLIMSLTAFSQIDTNKFTLPTKVGRAVVVDLIKGDECTEVLKSTHDLVNFLEKSNNLNLSQIKIYEEKISLYKSEIGAYQEKEIKYIDNIQCLDSKLKKTKKINYFLTVACSALALTTTVCFLIH